MFRNIQETAHLQGMYSIHDQYTARLFMVIFFQSSKQILLFCCQIIVIVSGPVFVSIVIRLFFLENRVSKDKDSFYYLAIKNNKIRLKAH